jgi:hypothetical protein
MAKSYYYSFEKHVILFFILCIFNFFILNDTVVVGFRDEPANFGNQLPEDGLTVCF